MLLQVPQVLLLVVLEQTSAAQHQPMLLQPGSQVFIFKLIEDFANISKPLALQAAFL
jgi:hypothetical protein